LLSFSSRRDVSQPEYVDIWNGWRLCSGAYWLFISLKVFDRTLKALPSPLYLSIKTSKSIL
jgi:hypothetical protein